MNKLTSAILIFILAAGLGAARAQEAPDVGPHPPASERQMESHIGKLTGHSQNAKSDYKRYCAGCHGDQGDGNGENAVWLDPKPRDFTLATFKCRSTLTGTLPTDEDLYNTIARGLTNSGMPIWNTFSQQQRADLVAYIKTLSPRWEKEKAGEPIKIPAEPPVTMESISHGKALFTKMECWKCHGPQGKGDGPSAPTLTDSKDQPIRPYDFSSGKDDSRFKCGSTNADLYRIFMTGVDGTPMPSFADVIQPNDAWDLVHFLRTLQVHHNSPELALWRSSEPQQKAETPSAPPLPGVPSPPAGGASAPTASYPAAATGGEAVKATAGAANPAPPAAEPQPVATPASGPATTGETNPAPAQPTEEPKPGTTNPVPVQPTVAPPPAQHTEVPKPGTTNPVPIQPTVSPPAGESKPPGAAVAISAGTEGAGRAVRPPPDPRSTGPSSEPSRTSGTVHSAPGMPSLAKTGNVELLDLAVGDEAGRISVTMMLSGPVVPQLRRLDSPARVVVELPKTVMVTPQQRIVVGKDGAKRVRLGTDAQVPPTTRVVVDLSKPLAYQIVQGGENTWILELYPNDK